MIRQNFPIWHFHLRWQLLNLYLYCQGKKRSKNHKNIQDEQYLVLSFPHFFSTYFPVDTKNFITSLRVFCPCPCRYILTFFYLIILAYMSMDLYFITNPHSCQLNLHDMNQLRVIIFYSTAYALLSLHLTEYLTTFIPWIYHRNFIMKPT